MNKYIPPCKLHVKIGMLPAFHPFLLLRLLLVLSLLIVCSRSFADDGLELIFRSQKQVAVFEPIVDHLPEQIIPLESGDRISTTFSPIQLAAFQESNGASAGSGETSGSGSLGDLAAKSQNPVSDLVSLPFQSNFDFGRDPGSRMAFTGNLQPVIPFKLNDDWNLISRMIVPFVNVPLGLDDRSHGIGDSLLQFYLSPRDSEEFIWGLGPNVFLPTASDPTLGTQEWGAGVNGVVLWNQKPMLYGALISQVWSVEGNTKPFLVQPFFNYNFPKGWFFSASGEFNADWERPEDRRYSFPLGAGIGRVFPILGQPVSISTRFAPYLEKPPGGPDWQFRLSVTYLFPK